MVSDLLKKIKVFQGTILCRMINQKSHIVVVPRHPIKKRLGWFLMTQPVQRFLVTLVSKPLKFPTTLLAPLTL